MKIILLFILSLVVSWSYIAQGTKATQKKIKVVGESSATPGYLLKDVVIQVDNAEYLKKYKNARYFIRRIYAYSQLASSMLNQYEDTLATMTTNRQKNKFLKKANRELKAEFGDEIKEMSVTRGEFLNKLIYRETGLSTYDIIKDYRGGAKAVFWQSLCRLNGQNLKVTYDAKGKDAIIERIVKEIEEGKIKTLPRVAVTKKGKDIQKRNKKKKRRNKKKKGVDLASK